MSRRLLLQSILKFREGIKSGTAKVQDIITDYFNQTGKSVTDLKRALELMGDAPMLPDGSQNGQATNAASAADAIDKYLSDLLEARTILSCTQY